MTKSEKTRALHEQVREYLRTGQWLQARSGLDELMQCKNLPKSLPELKTFRRTKELAPSFQAILQDRITGVNLAYRSQQSHQKWS